jgi:hypothetical protein
MRERPATRSRDEARFDIVVAREREQLGARQQGRDLRQRAGH